MDFYRYALKVIKLNNYKFNSVVLIFEIRGISSIKKLNILKNILHDCTI